MDANKPELSSSFSAPVERLVRIADHHEVTAEFVSSVEDLINMYDPDFSGTMVPDENTMSVILRSLINRVKTASQSESSSLSSKERDIGRILMAARLVLRCPYSPSYVIEEVVNVLCETAGVYKEDIKAEKVAEGFISYYNDHPSMVIESLKCLYNILSVERFRRDPIFSARVLYLLKIINVNYHSLEPEQFFYLSRILFYLYISHELPFEEVQYYSYNVLESIADGRVATDEKNMGYAVEGLRVLHLLGMKESSNNKEDPKMIALVLLAIDSLIKLDSKVKDHKYETLFKGITNFLHAVKLEFDATYLGQKTILGLARALLNHIQYTLAYYEKDPPDRKQQEKIDLSVCPLFDITRRVIKANPKAKDMCRTELLKTRIDKPPVSTLISLISPYSNERYQVAIGDTIYALCNDDSSEMIKIIGLGHAAGYLSSLKGSPLPSVTLKGE